MYTWLKRIFSFITYSKQWSALLALYFPALITLVPAYQKQLQSGFEAVTPLMRWTVKNGVQLLFEIT